MTLSTLRSRASRKRARITARDGQYQVFDTENDTLIGTTDSLLGLEDLIDWIDKP